MRRLGKNRVFLLAPFIIWALTLNSLRAEPPISGTIFLDPDIITEADPSTFLSIESAGEGTRMVFDRRVNRWLNLNVLLFKLRFEDGLEVEGRVNPEFSSSEAATLVAHYAQVLGRIPAVLKRDIESMTIHDGDMPFGGGNRNVLIHHQRGLAREAEGILEELLVHETGHTSLDSDHALATAWIAAQQSDGEFISDHAANFPAQEDISESFLLYLALDYRQDRIDETLRRITEETMPARLAYFREQGFDLYPLNDRRLAKITNLEVDPLERTVKLKWDSNGEAAFAVDTTEDLKTWQQESVRLPSLGKEMSQNLDLDNPQRFYRVRIVK